MAETATILTLDLTPKHREAIKPVELIKVTGHDALTLNARRMITILWHNAHKQGVEAGKRYTVEIDELKPDGHKGYEMVEEGIDALMRTVIHAYRPNGSRVKVQFLGGNDMDSPDRPAGVLTYSFDAMLIDLLKKSTIWGRIAIPILMAFTSKYALSLYENISQVVNLEYKISDEFSLSDFRQMLGVQPGKYKTFGELNKHVIKPAVMEVNALAPFNVAVLPVKRGKKVVSVKVGWWRKDADQVKEAFAEADRSKVGRRARISGNVDYVSAPVVSIERMRRQRIAGRPKTS